MANDDKQSGTGLASGSFIVVALLATGTFLFQREAPLRGARPALTEASIQEPIRGERQTIDARLWQDPFAAVAKDLDKSGKRELEQRCIGRSDDVICNSPLAAKDYAKTLVIAVTVPGAPYAEDAEHRRRTRYAVLAGLERSSYRPVDARHIGYFLWTQQARRWRDDLQARSFQVSASPAARDSPLLPPLFQLLRRIDQRHSTPPETASRAPNQYAIVPFEWFEALPEHVRRPGAQAAPNQPQPKAAQILLLWLKEETLRPQPLARIADLRDFLSGSENDLRESERFKIIGPYSSDLLRDMTVESDRIFASRKRTGSLLEPGSGQDFRYIKFYAYGASAPDDFLLEKRSSAASASELGELFKGLGIAFQRTTATDDTLAFGLASELDRRVPNNAPQQGDVALISEWDTFYGQTLPRSVERRFSKPMERRFPECSSEDKPCPHIHNLTYMRGLDGQLPSSSAADDRKTDGATPQGEKQGSAADFFKTQNDSKGVDRPVGQGQYDYIRRMSEQLRHIDEDLRKNGGKLKAVGVLGSDVFDKLLVLRALRPAFPEALFFTTDFDEALTMDSELPYTRNLIISSSFGPNLSKKLQDEVSPFRDAYQTSAFLATQLATDNIFAAGDKIAKELAVPRIFEIERAGHLLEFNGTGPDTIRDDVHSAPPSPGEFQQIAGPAGLPEGRSAADASSIDIRPDVEPLYPTYQSESQKSLAGGLAGGALLILALLFAPKVRRDAWVEVALLAAGLATSAAACFYWDDLARKLTGDGTGEPLAMMQGVSVWPTIFLRSLGIVLALYLVWRAQKNLRDNLTSIAEKLNLDPPPKRPWIREAGSLFDFLFGAQTPNLGLQSAWNSYCAQEEFLPRALRAALYTFLMYLIMKHVLVPLLGTPSVYIRSANVAGLYMDITKTNFVLMLFLAFFVFDATLLCLLFVNKLRANQSDWPEGAISRFNGILRLQGSPAHDWIDLEFVAKRTRCIASLIYFPFLLIALFIISRSTIFADYAPSVTFLVAQGISLSIVFGCAVMLCWAAKAARDAARENLSDAIIRAKGRLGAEADVAAVPDNAEQLQTLLIRIDQLKDGAFSPFSQQPLVRAVILPVGSFGWTVLIERGIIPGL